MRICHNCSVRRRIPSTAALVAFEAAARHQSYTRAAAELSVTQGAVCRQIAALEDLLGVELFHRNGRGVSLTEPGLEYARQVRSRLDEVERDAISLMGKRGSGGTLELGVVPTFATKWLLPRLPSFHRAHPGIQIHLSARTRPFLFDETTFDAAIHSGQAPWPGTTGRHLMAESLIPVCCPELAGPRRHFKSADWARHTLLQLSTRPYIWREWFSAHRLQVEGDLAGPRLELFSMLAEAAVHGLGVALVPPFLVNEELTSGRLVAVAPTPMASGRSYFLIYPEHKAGNPALTAFELWLVEQAGTPNP